MPEPGRARRHPMPFGAEPGAGGVRFRLWAPSASRVALLLLDARGGVARRLVPEPLPSGWFELVTDETREGSLYVYEIDGELRVPDPASRFQPQDVHGPSAVVDPSGFAWTDGAWRGRPWDEVVLYELHVGAFTNEGTFDGVRSRLDHLAALGVTAIELMPVADFPGRRNWGYDGVLPFAPDSAYGRPDDLKRLVLAAHERGLMVFLDVVYNHFGPDGNYLHRYARPFFDPGRHTPWGAAIRFEGAAGRVVRDFFIHNALYWLEEYHLDGLRLDAVDAIHDTSDPDFVAELTERVRRGPGASRYVHLVLENRRNEAGRLVRCEPGGSVAQWNDDMHHAMHCLLTGENDGYYVDFADDAPRHLARALAEGFAFQGEASAFEDGRPRGESSGDLPPTLFVNFLQNHDQVGNRPFGDRLASLVEGSKLRAAVATLLPAPSTPMLFMGEEWGSEQPFPFFCDFKGDLARSVTEGRRREFARFPRFHDPATRELIPDPNDERTFARAVLDWSWPGEPGHDAWIEHYRRLLALRRREIVPRLSGCTGGAGRYRLLDGRGIRVEWTLGDGSLLTLLANLDDGECAESEGARGRLLLKVGEGTGSREEPLRLGPWSVLWFLEERDGPGRR